MHNLVNSYVNYNYILTCNYRYSLTKKFCDALWKPTPNDYVCVRAKERFMLGPDIEKKLRIAQRRVKSMSIAFEFPKNFLERDDENDMEPLYSAFNSVIFLRSITPPWARYLSQKTRHYYVYNVKSGKAEYEIRNGVNNRPREAEANFIQAFSDRVIWFWPHDNTLSMETLVQMIKNPPQNT